MKKISAALLLTDGKVFLGCHSTGNKFYDLPKGQIDGNEMPLEACIREVKEETGLYVTKENIKELGLYPYTKQKDLHLFLYCTAQLPDLEEMECTSYFVHPYTREKTKEIDGYKYISFYEKENYVTKSMGAVLDKIQKEHQMN